MFDYKEAKGELFRLRKVAELSLKFEAPVLNRNTDLSHVRDPEIDAEGYEHTISIDTAGATWGSLVSHKGGLKPFVGSSCHS